MESATSGSGSVSQGKQKTTATITVTKDEVITKLKDDGDFDVLRLKIIRKLKENEDLRNNIISTVRQSAALNRAGMEHMKPRELSDAIFDEVGDRMMSQISDGLWAIIRSGDGMKKEIADTVQSVYNKMVEPEMREEVELPTHDGMVVHNKANCNGLINPSASTAIDNSSGNEPKEPPGFVLLQNNHISSHGHKEDLQYPVPYEGPAEEQKGGSRNSNDTLRADNSDVPPGFSLHLQQKQPCDDSDEDPDVPPGFG